MTPRPLPTDGHPTPTSQTQAETEEVLSRHFPPTNAPEPVLQKNSHMQFLIRHFIQGFPSKYISQDASQPWLMFWTIQSFSTLQVALDPGNKQRSGNAPFRDRMLALIL
jgi:protein farnesyltransferase subunit beta